MGDLSGALSGLGDSIGSLFSSAPAATTDASSAPIDLGAATGIGSEAGLASPIGTTFDPSTVFGGLSNVGGGIDPTIAADMTGSLGDLSGIANQAASIPATIGVQPGQTSPLFMGTATSAPTAAPTGAGAMPPTSVATPAVTPAGGNIPIAGGAGGGGGSSAGANVLDPSGGESLTPPSGTAGALTGSDPLGTGGGSSGGVLDWLSNQLFGGTGSLKNDISMLAALGGLGMSAFKPNAIPGAGQTLTPGGTSTGESVANAQQQQQLAAQEAATQAEQQKLAQQEQTIAGTQTAGAAPLMQTGQSQVAAAASGQLLPAQQAQVAAALAANQQQIRAKYANLGLSGSTMEQSDLDQANLQSQALIASLLNQNQTQGLTTVTGAENLLAGGGTSLAGASGDINTAVNALNTAVSGLGSSSNTYMAILQQQLAQDQELQKALGQMAQSLGTSTALTNLGNTAGATAA